MRMLMNSYIVEADKEKRREALGPGGGRAHEQNSWVEVKVNGGTWRWRGRPVVNRARRANHVRCVLLVCASRGRLDAAADDLQEAVNVKNGQWI